MPRPKFAKGNPGRPKGTPNKATAEVKEMLRAALEQAGGQEYLFERATDPSDKVRAAFLSLVGKLIPTEVKGTLEETLVIVRKFAGRRESDDPKKS